jgi:hypothetical protein
VGRFCGGFLENTVWKYDGAELSLFLSVPQQDPGRCVCMGTRADHSGGSSIPQVPLQPPSSQRVSSAIPYLPTTPYLPVPGPSRPVVDPSPITHVFSPRQQQGNTVNERRMASAARTATRNRGGVPGISSPPSIPTHGFRGNRARAASSSQTSQQATSKLTVFFLPLHVRGCVLPTVTI